MSYTLHSDSPAAPREPRTRLLLIPGYWLGGWAWDEVTALLNRHGSGIDAQAVTLPGLESADTDRAGIRFADHLEFLLARVREESEPCVLVAHSGAGALAVAVADAAPELISRIIYVDSGPVSDGDVPRPDLPSDVAELPFPGVSELAALGASVDGISEARGVAFDARALPHPAGPIREPIRLRDTARNDIPASFVCCSISADQVQQLVAEGVPMFAAVAALTDARYVDAPTGHWPMFSAPAQLAEILEQEAARG